MTTLNITNREQAFGTCKLQIESTRAFLHRIAKHLEENGMPGQAGNATIHALNLQQVSVALAYLERND